MGGGQVYNGVCSWALECLVQLDSKVKAISNTSPISFIMTRTVFVIGSSSGIGLATVTAFFNAGWNVAASSRDPASSKELQELQSQDEKRLLLVPIELTKPEYFQTAVDAVVNKYGGIDVLVNNAGINILGAFEILDQDKLRRIFDINYFGPAEITRMVIPHLRAASKKSGRKGMILNIGSGSGQFGLPLFTYYSSTKFAFEGLMESLHHELYIQNILVKNVIAVSGVKDTKIGENAFKESHPLFIAAFTGQKPDLSNEDQETRDVLNSYLDYTGPTMMKLMSVSDQAEGAPHASDVANLVLKAADDESRKFRYFIGDDVVPIFKAKMGGRAKDDEYMEESRQFFA